MSIVSVKPPFRADHVGSLMRPAAILAAHQGGRPDEDLKETENREIRHQIQMQLDLGFKSVTDGEMRRRHWPYDFLGALTNFDVSGQDSPSSGITLSPQITGALDFPAHHPALEDFRFLARHAGVVPRVAIPGPSCVHYGLRRENILYKPYRDNPEILFQDIARTYKKAVQAFYDAGCRYLQLDDIYFTYLSDPRQRAARRAMGQDPDDLINRYAWMLEDAITDRPRDMTIAMHMCRGNYSSAAAAVGRYDVATDILFNMTSVDVYFLEYDNPRPGSLNPLRLLPRGGKRVMAGFITTRSPVLESIDAICARFDQAAKLADPDQLGISPQCGFALSEEAGLLSIDDQRRKLELVIKVAEKIWGEV